MSDRYRLSENEAQEIFERHIAPTVFKNARSSDQPKAVVFGGQPGAGKTRLVDLTKAEIGTTVIEGDQFRAYHPRYQEIKEAHGKDAAIYTGPDAGRWTEMAIAHGIKHRYNLAIEGTMRNADTVRSTTDKLRAGGYEVEARAMAVPDLESWQGVHQRYERQSAEVGVRHARFTNRDAHDAAYTGMLNTLDAIERERLATRVKVYTRNDHEIYDSVRPDNAHSSARKAVEAERGRPFEAEKAERHDRKWEAVQGQQENRGASALERFKVETWREHDRVELRERTAMARTMAALDQTPDPPSRAAFEAKLKASQERRDENRTQALAVERQREPERQGAAKLSPAEAREKAEKGYKIAERLARDLPPGEKRDKALKAMEHLDRARGGGARDRADPPQQPPRNPDEDRDRD